MMNMEKSLKVARLFLERSDRDEINICACTDLSVEDVRSALIFLQDQGFIECRPSDRKSCDTATADAILECRVVAALEARHRFSQWFLRTADASRIYDGAPSVPGDINTSGKNASTDPGPVPMAAGSNIQTIEARLSDVRLLIDLCDLCVSRLWPEWEELEAIDRRVAQANSALAFATKHSGLTLNALADNNHPLARLWADWQQSEKRFTNVVEVVRQMYNTVPSEQWSPTSEKALPVTDNMSEAATPNVEAPFAPIAPTNFLKTRSLFEIDWPSRVSLPDSTTVRTLNALSRDDLQEHAHIFSRQLSVTSRFEEPAGPNGEDRLYGLWPKIRWYSDRAAMSGNAEARLFPAMLLRSYIGLVSKREWATPIESLFQDLNTNSIAQKACALNRLCLLDGKVGDQVYELRPGQSAFPEDRLYATALDSVFKMQGLLAIRPKTVTWGEGGADVDLQLHNELGQVPVAASAVDIDITNRVFLHSGYSLFASAHSLRRLGASAGIPRCVSAVLSPDGTLRSLPEDLTTEVVARCWIALCLGLPLHATSEYEVIQSRIRALLESQGLDHQHRREEHHHTFSSHLENFLIGDSPTFWGGSIHARLLKRWWKDYAIELLSPLHFGLIMSGTESNDAQQGWPPYNILKVGEEISGKLNGRTADFAQRATDLYREVGLFLARTAQQAEKEGLRTQWRGEGAALVSIRRWMGTLAASAVEASPDSEAQYCFVTSEEDMVGLMIEDNNFAPNTVTRGLPAAGTRQS